MAEIVRMPKMSDTMTEGVIAKWHKKVGDTVKSNELMAEIETDKATMDYESFNTGTVLYLGAKEGEAIQTAERRVEDKNTCENCPTEPNGPQRLQLGDKLHHLAPDAALGERSQGDEKHGNGDENPTPAEGDHARCEQGTPVHRTSRCEDAASCNQRPCPDGEQQFERQAG